MIRRRLRQHQSDKLTQGKRIGRPPGDPALRVQPLEVADQQQPEIAPGWQPWPTVVRIEALAQSFDVSVKAMLLENLIELRVEGMRGRSWVATHIEACFACRLRLPIAIGDSVVRGTDCVDPKPTFYQGAS
jgi:hypothetical protein